MTRTNRKNESRQSARRERHISVRTVRRAEPDLRKLSRALLQYAAEQAAAEAAAQAEHEQEQRREG